MGIVFSDVFSDVFIGRAPSSALFFINPTDPSNPTEIPTAAFF
jgi:hypothetical protein